MNKLDNTVVIEDKLVSYSTVDERSYFFNTPLELLTAVRRIVKETDVVLDIGCGIAPMNYFRPKLHLMVEPWKEYSDILAYRNSGDKSVIIVRTGALEALRQLADNSVDSIFLLDVIEHLEKDVGRQVIIEGERVAREQFVIFTPLGFMPQHMESNEVDGWGLGGGSVQEHLSGWEPEDFSAAWSFYICKDFHSVDFKGEPMEQTYGAFYATLNFKDKTILKPENVPNFRQPLPSELKVQELEVRLQTLEEVRSQYEQLLNSRGMSVIRFARKVMAFVGLR